MKAERKRRGGAVFAVALLVLLVLAALAAGLFFSRYMLFQGEKIARDTQVLDLRGRGLTDVEALSKLRSLQQLDVRENPLSTEQVDALQSQLPECEILYDVPVDGKSVDVLMTELTLQDLPEDWQALERLTHLNALTVERCTDPEAMEKLHAAMPGCAMRWNLGLGGRWFDAASEEVTVPGDAVRFDELLAQLPRFRSLRRLILGRTELTLAQQKELAEVFPEIKFSWTVPVGEKELADTTETVTFSPGEDLDVEELSEALELLPALKSVDFTDSAVSAADRIAFRDAHPELDVSWVVRLFGTEYPLDTQTLDFNKRKFTAEELDELEAAAELLPALEKVEMCDCGISNEDMDAMNKRHENVEFVWRVYFSKYNLRTDAVYFRPSEVGVYVPPLYDKDMEILKYCTNMQGLDLGHHYFTDLHFLDNMPHMKYLIIAECKVTDLSPLSNLKELKYLEAFSMPFNDITPLLGCTALSSLNICYNLTLQDDAWKVISQMSWLNRLWWCNCPLSWDQQQELKTLLPHCTFFFRAGGESSGGSWRYHEDYYEMRKFMGNAPPMAAGTNGLDEDGNQIIIDDAGTKFILEHYDNSQYWWTEPRYSMYHPYIIGVTV